MPVQLRILGAFSPTGERALSSHPLHSETNNSNASFCLFVAPNGDGEDELYTAGSTVVWSRNECVVKSLHFGNENVIAALFAAFGALPKERVLCVVLASMLKLYYSDSGKTLTRNLPFVTEKAWSLSNGGILFLRQVGMNGNGWPMLWTLRQPLDVVRPVSLCSAITQNVHGEIWAHEPIMPISEAQFSVLDVTDRWMAVWDAPSGRVSLLRMAWDAKLPESAQRRNSANYLKRRISNPTSHAAADKLDDVDHDALVGDSFDALLTSERLAHSPSDLFLATVWTRDQSWYIDPHNGV